MPTQVPTQKVEAMKRDHAAGMGVSAVANKHGVSFSTCYKYLKNAPGPNARQKRAARAHGGRVKLKSGGPAVDGVPTMIVTPELLDLIWAGLALEKKAALINKLPEL